MCLSMCYTHTCPHLSYIHHPCEPNAYPPTCPYRSKETKHLERKCGRCLEGEGVHADKDLIQRDKKRKLSEAAAARDSMILTQKRLKQAEDHVKQERKENRERRERIERERIERERIERERNETVPERNDTVDGGCRCVIL